MISKLGTVLPIAALVCAACSSTAARNDGDDSSGAAAAGSETPSEQAQDTRDELAASGVLDPLAPNAQSGGQDFLQGVRTDLTLAEQKKRLLVDAHMQAAREQLATANLISAEEEVLRALELDPDNVDAKALLHEVGALQGRPAGETSVALDELGAQYRLRLQQLRVEAEDSLRRGKLAMARNDYDAAIAEFTIATNHVRYAPAGVEWNGIDTEAVSLLERARTARTQAEEQARLSAQRDAYESLQEQEQAARDRRTALLNNMIEQAIVNFAKGDFETAQDYAEKALREDPRNEQAAEIRDAAFRSGREQVRDDYYKAKKEEFIKWQEELADMRVPWTEVYTLPDPDAWRELTDRRATRAGFDMALDVSPAERELRQRLTTTRIPGLRGINSESLNEVIDVVRTFTDLPLVVDPAAENAALDAGVVFEYELPNPMTSESALNTITQDAGEDVTWTIRHDAILITTREKARGQLLAKNHDVQDLVFGLTDFLGPRIDRLRLLDDMEDDDGGGPFGAIGERANLIDISTLSTLIQENVAVGSWEDEGIRIDEGEGYLLVVHTPDVQGKVRAFLDDLRRFSSSLVTIESKFMTVGSNWLQEIGVDWRGLDNPGSPFTDLDDVTNGLEDMASRGLDNNGSGAAAGSPSAGFFYDRGSLGDVKGTVQNFFGNPLGSAIDSIGGITAQVAFLNDMQVSTILRAVEKSQNFSLINDQVLSVHNTQRAYVSVINQQAYIQDFDVEVAQFQAVADPQINVLTEGVVLDVRPTIHFDRKYLTLEIQPTVAKVISLRTFSSTLGGNTSPVEFQLPELEVQSIFTTAVIPDGASILLGGLSSIRNVERRAEVPWLAKIPLVGFFFKSEGYDDENESLMILIKAQITDVRDELKRIESAAR